MEFFSRPVSAPDPPAHQPVPVPIWLRPPQDEVPIAIAFARRLARVPGAALTLQRFDVHREGVLMKLRLDLLLEDAAVGPERARIAELLDPRGIRPGTAGQLRVGVTLTDGRRAETSTDGTVPLPWDTAPEAPHLSMVGGGGSGEPGRWRSDARVWLWPLPPAAVFTLHYVCEGAGIAEGAIDIDASVFVDAADGVIDIWGD